jgi:hypothetical protein
MQNNRRLPLDAPATYLITVQGRLDDSWSSWFDGMSVAIENSDAGLTITTLTGTVSDQAALYGLLSRVRDMGLPLLLVQRIEQE